MRSQRSNGSRQRNRSAGAAEGRGGVLQTGAGSAGCVKKTMDNCSGRRGDLYSEQVLLFDRMKNRLPVTINCRNCSNIIWNAHPTSLHAQLGRILESEEFDHLRIDFTTEDEKRTLEVLCYYVDRVKGKRPVDIFVNESFTTGHFKREAE